MKIVFAIIKKEFLQLIRNKILVRIIFLLPIIQLSVLIFAANFEIKNTSLSFIDNDNSTTSREILNRLQASNYFILKDYGHSFKTAQKLLNNNSVDVIVEIPLNFEAEIFRGESPRVSVTMNAINGMKAGVVSSYIGTILSEYGIELSKQTINQGPQIEPSRFDITFSNWFNPMLSYKSMMLPGILCVLITILGILITALNIVREKEIGTIEQLNVTPISNIQFLTGKLIPYGIVSMLQLTLGLLISVFIFNLKIEGSLLLLYGIILIYMISVLSLGFLISLVSETQSQAMFVTIFFIFTFILLSGLFTPVESMPIWAQKFVMLNPTYYIMDATRLIILKGSTFKDISMQFYTLSGFAVILSLTALLKYKKEA